MCSGMVTTLSLYDNLATVISESASLAFIHGGGGGGYCRYKNNLGVDMGSFGHT